MSSLNPSALPYIPSQKKGYEHQSETDEASGFQSEAHLGKIDSFGHITDNICDHAISKDEGADEAAVETEMELEHELEMELDLNIMSTIFPSTSRASLADIYHANNDDMRASVEMMKELEDFSANKDLEHSTQKDETQKERPDQGFDVAGESSSSN